MIWFSEPYLLHSPLGLQFYFLVLPYSLQTAEQFVTIYFAIYPGHYDGLLRWPIPKITHLGPGDQPGPLNPWTQKIQPTPEPPFRRPTSSTKNETFVVALHRFIPHSKLFNEIRGYVSNDTFHLEIFSGPLHRNNPLKILYSIPFPRTPQSFFPSFHWNKLSHYREQSNLAKDAVL